MTGLRPMHRAMSASHRAISCSNIEPTLAGDASFLCKLVARPAMKMSEITIIRADDG